MEKGKKASSKPIHSFHSSTKGQLTIFIIVGLILVVGVVAFFMIRGNVGSGISKEFEPAYKAYLSCIQDKTEEGLTLLGQQGGYIYTEELGFDSGSSYMPSSSQLSFYGNAVPYWLYISGNNILKEQIPSKSNMETDLSRYVREGLADCDFSSFNQQGIYVDIADGEVNTVINSNDVQVDLKNMVLFSFENDSAYVKEHEVKVSSKIGKFYDYAANIYSYEKSDFFLESYALDVLRLNAPVTGVEVTCKPQVFNEADVKEELATALQNNFAYLKLKGNYYSLSDEQNNYFVVDSGQNVDANVNILYSTEWPTKIEMYGEKVIQPVGTQNGLGILGMCFVPYHFVYDMSFPVMIQFYSNDELFQFPVVVVVKNNQAREALLTNDEISADSPICQTRNQQVQVSTYDLDLNPVEASLRFSCLTDSCDVGTTTQKLGSSSAIVDLPQCVNAVLTAYAEGYAPANYILSTNTETKADILMKKIYDVKVDLGNVASASVVFSSEDYSAVLNYPEDREVSLIEGEYNITAYVYKNSTIVFPAINDRKCVEVASTSFAGLLGDSTEQCFDINIPSQEVDMALVGGGRGYDYFTETQFKDGKELNLNIPLFKTPTNLEELQNNYITWEDASLDTRWE